MTLRHGILAILLLAVSIPPGLAAQANINGENKSWCTSSIPAECAVETYGPNAPLFSRTDSAQRLIDSRTVTSGSTCQKIVGAAFADFMIEGEPQSETPDGNAIVPHVGSHITGNGYDVVFIATSLGSGEEMLITILHEAAHHVDTAYTHWMADAAARGCLQDEEDDDGDDDGGDGDPEPTTTCTDSKEWVPPVTMRVWVKPESTMGESGPPVDLDHEVGAYLPGIVINVESGYWEEVIVSDGYYRTVTTCTTG